MRKDAFLYSVLVGFLASLTSVLSRYASTVGNIGFKLCLYGLCVPLTILMITAQAKSMHHWSTITMAQTVNMMSNFVWTALFGFVLWNESFLSLHWIAGIVLMSFGTYLSSDTSCVGEQRSQEEKKND